MKNSVLKASIKKKCEICNCAYNRKMRVTLNVPINDENMKKGKEALLKKAKKPYTCKVCKSIKEEIS